MRPSALDPESTAHSIPLGSFIRMRRQEIVLTQAELATRCGWNQERISLLETGRYGMPSLRGLALLADGLEVTLADLIVAAGFALSR